MFAIPIVYSTTYSNTTIGLGTDMSNQKSDQNYFIITPDAINVQKDETQLEQQRLSKEAEFNLKKEIKNNYLNEMWATYSSTIILLVDLLFFSAFIIITNQIFKIYKLI
jgi:hypothetical protein